MAKNLNTKGKCSTKNNTKKQTWLDTFLGKYTWYRRLRKGVWYKHEYTEDASELTFVPDDTFWARYKNINRYSRVISSENYDWN